MHIRKYNLDIENIFRYKNIILCVKISDISRKNVIKKKCTFDIKIIFLITETNFKVQRVFYCSVFYKACLLT